MIGQRSGQLLDTQATRTSATTGTPQSSGLYGENHTSRHTQKQRLAITWRPCLGISFTTPRTRGILRPSSAYHSPFICPSSAHHPPALAHHPPIIRFSCGYHPPIFRTLSSHHLPLIHPSFANRPPIIRLSSAHHPPIIYRSSADNYFSRLRYY